MIFDWNVYESQKKYEFLDTSISYWRFEELLKVNLFFGCDDNGKAKLNTSIFRSDAAMAKATYTHNSYKKTKVDIFPQKELLEGLWKVSVELNKKHNIVYPGDKALKKRGS